MYEDGHEREDVVVYRNETFLPLMTEMDRRSVGFEPDGEGGWNVIQPRLRNGERRVMLYLHESCFHQKDFRKTTGFTRLSRFYPERGKVALSTFRIS